ncbi:MAG: ribosomal-processing cysteine protease Prp [Ruminococcaceae bacterium]|nr:ribosomal-processing cysteine protease Prp [Oscillospiraceae bacterium]
MIRIVHDDERFILTACGHANYAEKGKDIVCAAASALVFNLIGYCDKVEKYCNGMKIVCDKDDCEARTVFKAVTHSLKVLERSYPENILVTLGNLNDDTQERLQKG